MKTVRGLVLGALIGALVMTLVPAAAAPQSNNPTVEDNVQPTIIPHFGGDDCTDPVVGTEATHSLRIPSPMSGSFTDGTVVVNLVVNSSQRTVNFSINTPGWVAFDVVIKGGTNSNHYDYLASAVGPQTSDTVLHSPPKGNRYDNLSHVTICYDEAPPVSISGTKFHDRDTDGVRDDDNGDVEEGLAGWTIVGFDQNGVEAAFAVTDTDGNYSMQLLGSGPFVICEEIRDDDLPPSFVWQQSAPGNDDCAGFDTVRDLAPAGHTVPPAIIGEVDFGNHLAVVLGCGDSATIDEEGKPSATVTLSEDCDSPTQAYPFDVGVSPDEDFKQFVVFGGVPGGSSLFTETIDWVPYFLDYLPNGTLEIPPTFVILQPGGTPVVGVDCDPGQPNTDVPDCRRSRTAVVTSEPPGSEFDVKVEENEVWEFLGDPTRGKR
jgi:hypothetical protein